MHRVSRIRKLDIFAKVSFIFGPSERHILLRKGFYRPIMHNMNVYIYWQFGNLSRVAARQTKYFSLRAKIILMREI